MFAECRTGELRVTQGHNLPARYVIHTVGPKYNLKYQTAAENTLYFCYRSVFNLILETYRTLQEEGEYPYPDFIYNGGYIYHENL
jgi:hypothetical protein